jgi:hypothetical protein
VTTKPSAALAERITGVGLLWGMGGVLFFVTTGVYPRTSLGWALFIGLAPVLFLFGEIVGEGAIAALSRAPGVRQVKASVERATADRGFSWARIAVALFATLGLLALIVGVFFVVRGSVGETFRPVGEFLRVHFGAV